MSIRKTPKYHRGDTFTIEIAEIHTHFDDKEKPYNIYRVKGFDSLFLTDIALNKLTKRVKYRDEGSN